MDPWMNLYIINDNFPLPCYWIHGIKPATDVALTSIRSWSAWEWTWHHVLGGLVCWFPKKDIPIRFSYCSGLLGTYKLSVSYELISVSFIGEGWRPLPGYGKTSRNLSMFPTSQMVHHVPGIVAIDSITNFSRRST